MSKKKKIPEYTNPILKAIHVHLLALKGVKKVKIRINRTAEIDKKGLPGKSIHVKVKGGEKLSDNTLDTWIKRFVPIINGKIEGLKQSGKCVAFRELCDSLEKVVEEYGGVKPVYIEKLKEAGTKGAEIVDGMTREMKKNHDDFMKSFHKIMNSKEPKKTVKEFVDETYPTAHDAVEALEAEEEKVKLAEPVYIDIGWRLIQKLHNDQSEIKLRGYPPIPFVVESLEGNYRGFNVTVQPLGGYQSSKVTLSSLEFSKIYDGILVAKITKKIITSTEPKEFFHIPGVEKSENIKKEYEPDDEELNGFDKLNPVLDDLLDPENIKKNFEKKTLFQLDGSENQFMITQLIIRHENSIQMEIRDLKEDECDDVLNKYEFKERVTGIWSDTLDYSGSNKTPYCAECRVDSGNCEGCEELAESNTLSNGYGAEKMTNIGGFNSVECDMSKIIGEVKKENLYIVDPETKPDIEHVFPGMIDKARGSGIVSKPEAYNEPLTAEAMSKYYFNLKPSPKKDYWVECVEYGLSGGDVHLYFKSKQGYYTLIGKDQWIRGEIESYRLIPEQPERYEGPIEEGMEFEYDRPELDGEAARKAVGNIISFDANKNKGVYLGVAPSVESLFIREDSFRKYCTLIESDDRYTGPIENGMEFKNTISGLYAKIESVENGKVSFYLNKNHFVPGTNAEEDFRREYRLIDAP